jgi:hypothetical protein
MNSCQGKSSATVWLLVVAFCLVFFMSSLGGHCSPIIPDDNTEQQQLERGGDHVPLSAIVAGMINEMEERYPSAYYHNAQVLSSQFRLFCHFFAQKQQLRHDNL